MSLRRKELSEQVELASNLVSKAEILKYREAII